MGRKKPTLRILAYVVALRWVKQDQIGSHSEKGVGYGKHINLIQLLCNSTDVGWKQNATYELGKKS